MTNFSAKKFLLQLKFLQLHIEPVPKKTQVESVFLDVDNHFS